MTDQEILNHIGLSPEKLRDLLQKFNSFLNGLEREQRQAFLRSLKTPQAAAAELDEDVTPERLQTLLGKHAPANGALCFICNFSSEPPQPPAPPEPTGPQK